MSVTQYMGARYVPLFADPLAWDITQQYEPLTIVSYQGNSYTSRQAVPAGIDITNTAYWALTGNYNAQIEQYRAEVQTYDSRITANTSSNATQDAQLAGTSASGLKTLIDANTADNSTHTAQLAGTSESGLKTLIDANTTANSTHTAQLAGTSESGLKTLIDANTTDNSTHTAQLAGTSESGLKSMIDILTNVKSGGTILPSYIGDFMDNAQFGCCCRAGNNFYTFSSENYDGYGNARIFNLASNALASKSRILMGHCNSCAYDSVRNRIWLVPMHTYSAGVATPTNQIYYYNESLTSQSFVSFNDEQFLYGVSFDHITKILYAFAVYTRTGPIKIYRMLEDESEFSYYASINIANFDTHVTGNTDEDIYHWQDFAVYNGILFAAKTEGTTFCLDLNDSNKLIWTFRIGMNDAGGIWKYGEIEGIEFGPDGNLYNARNALVGQTNTGEHSQINCCFATELNMPWAITQNDVSKQTIYGTLTLITDNVFRLGRSHIRSLNQLNWRNSYGNSNSVRIPSGVTYEEGIVRLTQVGNFFIEVVGTLKITNVIYNFGSTLEFALAGGTIISEGTNFCQIGGNAITVFDKSSGTLNIANRMFYCTAPKLILVSGLDSGETVKINNANRGNGAYFGNNVIATF